MSKQQKAILGLLITLFLPFISWFFIAKFYYGFNKTNMKIRIPAMIEHTFELLPLTLSLILGLIFGIIITILIFIFIEENPFKGVKIKKFYRGSQIVTAKRLASLTRKLRQKQLTIANIPVPVDVETTHFALIGATGTGKTTIIKEMMYGVLKRQDRMVVLDPDGEFYKTFGKKNDLILNPYDKRSQKWSFFNEIEDDYDFERNAASIVQKSNSSDSEEWNRYGRLFLTETARKLYATRANPTTQELFYLTNIVDTEEIKEFLEGTPAQSLFAEGAERALGSTRFVLGNSLSSHLQIEHGDFSIRKWLRQDNNQNLFITWREPQRAALKPLISCWVDILFTSVLGMEQNLKKRLFCFIDELESLSNLPTLGDALTKGRKKGLCLVNGFQTYTQLQNVYGDKQAETMLSNHRSLVCFAIGRTGDATANFISKALGQHEIERIKSNMGLSSKNIFTSNQSEYCTENVVLTSEIMALKNLEGFVSFAGDYPIARFKTKITNYQRTESIEPFVKKTRGVVDLHFLETDNNYQNASAANDINNIL